MEFETAWTRTWGGSGVDGATSARIGSDGTIYVAGTSEIGSFTYYDPDLYPNGAKIKAYDAILKGFASDGRELWGQTIRRGNIDVNKSTGIALGDNNSIYTSGWTQNEYYMSSYGRPADIRIGRYAVDGTETWSKCYSSGFYDSIPYPGGGGDIPDYASDIVAGTRGTVFAAGYTYGNLEGTRNNGGIADYKGPDAFLGKWSESGEVLWMRLVGTSEGDTAQAVTTDHENAVYITGTTNGNLGKSANSGYSDVFVSKFSFDGVQAWTQSLGSSARDDATAIACDDSGFIYVTFRVGGPVQNDTDLTTPGVYLVKYSPDGTRQWSRLIGGVNATSVTVSSDRIYVAGDVNGGLDGQTSIGGKDIFLNEYRLDGEKQWTKLLGTEFDDGAYSAALGSDGSICIAGWTAGVPNDQQNGQTDAMLIKLQKNNASPLDIVANTSAFNENISAGSVVASLTTTDPDAGDTFTYALISGTGDSDNLSLIHI